MRVLALHHNSVHSIPHPLPPCLRVLLLHDNPLRSVPHNVLTPLHSSLHHLTLARCRLVDISQLRRLSLLGHLRHLTLEGNPFRIYNDSGNSGSTQKQQQHHLSGSYKPFVRRLFPSLLTLDGDTLRHIKGGGSGNRVPPPSANVLSRVADGSEDDNGMASSHSTATTLSPSFTSSTSSSVLKPVLQQSSQSGRRWSFGVRTVPPSSSLSDSPLQRQIHSAELELQKLLAKNNPEPQQQMMDQMMESSSKHRLPSRRLSLSQHFQQYQDNVRGVDKYGNATDTVHDNFNTAETGEQEGEGETGQVSADALISELINQVGNKRTLEDNKVDSESLSATLDLELYPKSRATSTTASDSIQLARLLQQQQKHNRRLQKQLDKLRSELHLQRTRTSALEDKCIELQQREAQIRASSHQYREKMEKRQRGLQKRIRELLVSNNYNSNNGGDGSGRDRATSTEMERRRQWRQRRRQEEPQDWHVSTTNNVRTSASMLDTRRRADRDLCNRTHVAPSPASNRNRGEGGEGTRRRHRLVGALGEATVLAVSQRSGQQTLGCATSMMYNI